MNPEPTIEIAVASRVLAQALKPLIDRASDAIKDLFAKWRNDSAIRSLAEQLSNVAKVKTIWNIERELSLYSFYYPLNVQFTEHVAKRINCLRELGSYQNYVIEGTVGQGKSIFLRYLCAQELRQETTSYRIPIFVELRRIQGAVTLEQAIFDAFKRLGLAISEDLLSYYAREGRVVLLLVRF